jgi:hypothetical protein
MQSCSVITVFIENDILVATIYTGTVEFKISASLGSPYGSIYSTYPSCGPGISSLYILPLGQLDPEIVVVVVVVGANVVVVGASVVVVVGACVVVVVGACVVVVVGATVVVVVGATVVVVVGVISRYSILVFELHNSFVFMIFRHILSSGTSILPVELTSANVIVFDPVSSLYVIQSSDHCTSYTGPALAPFEFKIIYTVLLIYCKLMFLRM